MLAGNGVAVARRSRWYRSDPVPRSDQPPFVNGVADLATALSAADLLDLLHRIEAALGRERREANEARVIDLDLLDYDGRIVGGDGDGGLVLPHPRLHRRAFVLLPLRDIAPDWRHPVTGLGVGRLIDDLDGGQVCVPVPPSVKSP